MSIWVNEGGTHCELNEVWVNEGGTHYELNEVWSNEGGTHYEIYRKSKGPDVLNWKDEERGRLLSSANNGYSLTIYGYVSIWSNGQYILDQPACNSVLSDEFTVKAGTTITVKLTAVTTTNAMLRVIVYKAPASVVDKQFIIVIDDEAVFEFTEDGTYKLGLYTYYESRGQNTSYNSSNASLEITFA